MRQYNELVAAVFHGGVKKGDRTGTGTRSLFGAALTFDMADGFPLVTTKYTNFRAVVAELTWFLSGSTNTNDLDSTIWDEWATDSGDLGPIYGEQWRNFGGVDQIEALKEGLRNNPNSRRHLVSAWNPPVLPIEGRSPQWNVVQGRQALAPCHVMFQCYVADDKLDLLVYQRSADLFLGVPFNIASYALLLHLLAADTGYEPGRLIWMAGDCHLYNNHEEQVLKLLHAPEHTSHQNDKLPTLHLDDGINVSGYTHGPRLSAPVAV